MIHISKTLFGHRCDTKEALIGPKTQKEKFPLTHKHVLTTRKKSGRLRPQLERRTPPEPPKRNGCNN